MTSASNYSYYYPAYGPGYYPYYYYHYYYPVQYVPYVPYTPPAYPTHTYVPPNTYITGVTEERLREIVRKEIERGKKS